LLLTPVNLFTNSHRIMKANKTDSQKKAAKKAEKKALEESLTTKLFEAVKSLGHDAEKIGEDLILVSKFVAKKISKRMKSTKPEAPKEPKEPKLKPQVAVKTKPAATSNKENTVAPLATETIPVKIAKPRTKSTKAVKAPAKKAKPAATTDNEHIN